LKQFCLFLVRALNDEVEKGQNFAVGDISTKKLVIHKKQSSQDTDTSAFWLFVFDQKAIYQEQHVVKSVFLAFFAFTKQLVCAV
jgi:hypothetical protein